MIDLHPTIVAWRADTERLRVQVLDSETSEVSNGRRLRTSSTTLSLLEKLGSLTVPFGASRLTCPNVGVEQFSTSHDRF